MIFLAEHGTHMGRFCMTVKWSNPGYLTQTLAGHCDFLGLSIGFRSISISLSRPP